MTWAFWLGCGLVAVSMLGPYVLIYRLSTVVQTLCRIVVSRESRVGELLAAVHILSARVEALERAGSKDREVAP